MHYSTTYQNIVNRVQKLSIRRLTLLLIVLLLIAWSLNSAGCVKHIYIRQSITPVPEEAHGVLYIATSKPITVGVEGTDVYFRRDMGGYYLIHKDDLKAMIAIIRRSQKEANDPNEDSPSYWNL